MKNENNIGSNENDRENVNIMKENEHPADTGGGTPGEKKLNDRKAMLTALFSDKAYVPMKAKELAVFSLFGKSGLSLSHQDIQNLLKFFSLALGNV